MKNKQIQNMLKEAQKAQQKMMDYQTQLEAQTFIGSAGGGVVKAYINGSKKMTKMELAPEVVDPEDIEMLQDLLLTAINDALDQIEKASNEQISALTGNLKIPGLNF